MRPNCIQVKRGMTQANESCLRCECVISYVRDKKMHVWHVTESCLIHEYVMSHSRTCHISHTSYPTYAINDACFTCDWVIISQSLTRRINNSCFIYDRVIPSIIHRQTSCRTDRWVMSRGRMRHVFRDSYINASFTSYSCVWDMRSHVSHTNLSCLTHELVMSHTRTCHVSHTNLSCLTHELVMSHVSRENAPCVSCFTHKWVMSHIHGYSIHIHISQENAPCVSCFTYKWVITFNLSFDQTGTTYWFNTTNDTSPGVCVTWPLHMWDVTHSHLRRHPFTFETLTFIGEIWPIHMWDMTPS